MTDELLNFMDKYNRNPEDVLQVIKSQTDNDTLYQHQAVKQLDSEKFWEAMSKRNQGPIHQWQF